MLRLSGPLARRFSTSATPSGAGLGRALIAAAVAAPIGFVVYKYQHDPSYFDPLFKSSRVEPSKHQQVRFVTEPVEKPFKIDLAELDDIETRLPCSFVANFTAEAVEQVKQQVQEADDKAQQSIQASQSVSSSPDEAQSGQDSKNEAPSEKESIAPAAVAPVENAEGTSTLGVARDAIKKLRQMAFGVSTQAEQDSKLEAEKAEKLLRKEMEHTLSKDLSSSSLESLKERVVELTLELKDRNRWEAARLHEIITRVTDELSSKYLSILREQEQAFENLIRTEVAEAAMQATVATEERLAQSIQDRLLKQRESLRAEMELNIAKSREEERELGDIERTERLQALEVLQGRLGEIEASLKENEKARARLNFTRIASLALLKFTRVALLEKSSPDEIEAHLSELRMAAAGDSVISQALNSLPSRVFAGGIPSLTRLCKDFETDVKPDLVRIAMLPENATFMQESLAKLSYALLLSSTPSASPQDESVSAVCSKTLELLERQDLVSAFNQLESLPKDLIKRSSAAQTWVLEANDRIRVEAAVRLIAARLEENKETQS